MKEFFEDVKKLVTETVDTVSAKTEEVIEIQKLKSQIRSLENDKKRDYIEMGMKLYKKYEEGEVLEPEFMELCDCIKDKAEQIEHLEKDIERAQL